ncbi:hypothetical protein CHARACLAT_020567 [Characodon lateralis]|uniref:Uncharacterized protein n=1 Tax=Characodon lateralis TaxID=208331 RepID=A0ABU7E2M5_9TELE|nr:hypothetical protein [Characodon lateralis]
MQRAPQRSRVLSEDSDMCTICYFDTHPLTVTPQTSQAHSSLNMKASIMNDSGGEQSPSFFPLNCIINRSDSSSETNKHRSFWIRSKLFIRRCAVLHSRHKQKMGL